MKKKRETEQELMARLEPIFCRAAAAGNQAAISELRRILSNEDFPSTLHISVEVNGVKMVVN